MLNLFNYVESSISASILLSFRAKRRIYICHIEQAFVEPDPEPSSG